MTESAYLTEDGQLIAHSVPDDNDQDDLPSQLGGENIPQIENSGEKIARSWRIISPDDKTGGEKMSRYVF
jgi:hypothetical protein